MPCDAEAMRRARARLDALAKPPGSLGRLEALAVDLKRILDLAAAATQVHGVMDFHTKNAIAIERLKTEFKGKVELVQFPAPVLRDLRKIATQVIRDQSEKSPMARKVHASFTRFQALVGGWDHVAEGAYQQLVRA